jgi:hypothetical protein
MSLNSVSRNVFHSCRNTRGATESEPWSHRSTGEPSRKRRSGLMRRMTMVKTSMATRKIRCSWSQHPCSSQLTFISPFTAAVDLVAVRRGGAVLSERRGNKFGRFHYGNRRGESAGRFRSRGRRIAAAGWLAATPRPFRLKEVRGRREEGSNVITVWAG